MTHKNKSLMAALIAGTTLATSAWAQFGGQPFPGGPGAMPPGATFPGGQFGGRPNPPGGPFGGPGTGRSMMPFAFGSISAVNVAAGTLTLSPVPGGDTGQTIKVTGKTQISAQKEVKLFDLKVGDSVQVEGTPTGITASQISVGEDTGGFPGSGFGSGSPFGTGGPNGGMGGSSAAGSGFAQARGKITSVSPLTISLSDTVSVILKAAPELKIIKTVTETLSDLKVGDRVMAGGQSDASGVLTADSLRVNMGSFVGPSRPGFH